MPSCAQHSSRPPAPPPAPPSSPSIFSSEFLAGLRERDEAPTALEADLSGPWRTDPVPGRPGCVGVLRAWESLEDGDQPRAVFSEEELAMLCVVALPLVGREPLFHLGTEAGAQGYPVMAVDGERGPVECGALALFEPEVVSTLHVLQGLVRSPAALAALIEAAGPGRGGSGRTDSGRTAERGAVNGGQ